MNMLAHTQTKMERLKGTVQPKLKTHLLTLMPTFHQLSLLYSDVFIYLFLINYLNLLKKDLF